MSAMRMRLGAAAVCCAFGTVTLAESSSNAFTATDLTDLEDVAENSIGFRSGSFVVVPIPRSDPTLGAGLVLGAGYIFKADEASENSFVALGGMKTNNGSTAVGAATNLSFAEGRWELKFGYGQADVNYEIDVLGGLDFGRLPINQIGDIANASLSYGVSQNLFVGFDVTWLQSTVTTEIFPDILPPVYSRFGVEVEQIIYGPTIRWNTVDDSFYPTTGLSFDFAALKGEGLDNFGADFWKYSVNLKGYYPISDRVVLGGKTTACRVDGTAPFFSLCGLGVTDGFRGYASGLFFDEALLSVQSELRVRATNRLGGSIFLGAAAIDEDFGSFSSDEILSAYGVGLRYRLSKKFPLDFSVDAAWNDQGEQTTYVYVGQAF